LPEGYTVNGVWVDEIAIPYENIDSHLLVTYQAEYGPITKDLIVSLSPVPVPSAVWLLGSGLIGFLGFRRKFRRA